MKNLKIINQGIIYLTGILFVILLFILLPMELFSQGSREKKRGEIIMSPAAPTPSKPSESQAPADPVGSSEYKGYAKFWKPDTTFIFGIHGKSWGKAAAKVFIGLGLTYDYVYDAFYPDSWNTESSIKLVNDTNSFSLINSGSGIRDYWFKKERYDFFQELRAENIRQKGNGTKIIITPTRSFGLESPFSGEHYMQASVGDRVSQLEDTLRNLGWGYVRKSPDVVSGYRVSPSPDYSFIYGNPVNGGGIAEEKVIVSGAKWLNLSAFFKSQWHGGIKDDDSIKFELRTAIYADSANLARMEIDYPGTSDTVAIAKVKVWRRLKLGQQADGTSGLWLYALLSEHTITKGQYEMSPSIGGDDTLRIKGFLHEKIKDKKDNVTEIKLRDIRTRFGVLNKEPDVWNGPSFMHEWKDSLKIDPDTSKNLYRCQIAINPGEKVYVDWQDGYDKWGLDSRKGTWEGRMFGAEIPPYKSCYDSLVKFLRSVDSVKYKEVKELTTEASNLTYEVYSTNVIPITFMRGLLGREGEKLEEPLRAYAAAKGIELRRRADAEVLKIKMAKQAKVQRD